MVRVAVGGISHETNTFATRALGLTELAAFRPTTGSALLRSAAAARSYLGGMLDACAELDFEPVGLLFGITEPSGTIADAAFEMMRGELLARLAAAMAEEGGIDAVALELHGAGVAQSYPDIEGALASAVRDLVGPDVPIVGAFDLHGNISPACVATFDFMVPVWYYPHTDCYDRGLEAVRMLPRLLGLGASGVVSSVPRMRTVAHLERLPMQLPTCMMCTQAGFPASELHMLCQRLERRHATAGVLDVSVFHGFPYADIAIAGTTVLVTAACCDGRADHGADGTSEELALARAAAREVGAWLWAQRERFRSNAASADAAVAVARRQAVELGGMVCINETADNTGCGAPGDATHLLRALLRADAGADAGAETAPCPPLAPGDAAFGWMYDPAVLQQAVAAGEGATIDVSIGGKLDEGVAGDPVCARALVVKLTDGRFPATPGSAYGEAGVRNLGRMARLRIGNVDLLVNGVRVQAFDEGAFTLAGIDVTQCKIVGIKSSTHFRAGWAPIAAAIITADEPGLSSNKLEVFDQLREHKLPYWPTHAAATYVHANHDSNKQDENEGEQRARL